MARARGSYQKNNESSESKLFKPYQVEEEPIFSNNKTTLENITFIFIVFVSNI